MNQSITPTITPIVTPTMPQYVLQSPQTGSEINLTAEYGRTKTYFSSIIGCCFLLCFLISGGYVIKSAYSTKDTKKNVVATITNSSFIGNNNYNVSVRYVINNTEYNNSILSNKPQYVGNTIEIYYDIKNPNNISVDSPTKVILSGTSMIMCALCLCSLIAYNMYSVSKYDDAAINAAYSGSRGNMYGYPSVRIGI